MSSTPDLKLFNMVARKAVWDWRTRDGANADVDLGLVPQIKRTLKELDQQIEDSKGHPRKLGKLQHLRQQADDIMDAALSTVSPQPVSKN